MNLNLIIFSWLILLGLNGHAQNDTRPHTSDSLCLENKEIHHQDRVDQAAIPPNGFMKFREEVKKEIKMPTSALENGIAGRVTLEFVICKDGYIHNVVVLKSKSEDCDKEAIRVLHAMGEWTPAQKNQIDITSIVRYSFNFTMKN